MAARVRKAVFPVAGLGTRFLPATKAMPKEMLTVVDRPLIQHVVDEAREAGIEHFVFVTGRNKGVIEDHFDRQFELEQTLAERGKTAELEALQSRSAGPGSHELHAPAGAARPRPCRLVRARARRQRALRAAASRRAGAGHGKGCLAQMLDAYATHGGNIIAVEPVPEDQAQALRRRQPSAKADGKRASDRRHGGEAEARNRALQPHHSRPLHPAAGDLRILLGAGARRRRRDPDHRRHAGAARAPALLRGEI